MALKMVVWRLFVWAIKGVQVTRHKYIMVTSRNGDKSERRQVETVTSRDGDNQNSNTSKRRQPKRRPQWSTLRQCITLQKYTIRPIYPSISQNERNSCLGKLDEVRTDTQTDKWTE